MKGQGTKSGALEGSSTCIMKYKSIYVHKELAKNCTGGTNAGAKLSKYIHLH